MKIENTTFVIASMETDEDRFSSARLESIDPAIGGGGYVTDHPYWAGDEDSHYVPRLSGMKVGDEVTL